jgi:hypothetical protein
MAQGKFKPAGGLKKKKAKGATRKHVGKNGKSTGSTMPSNMVRDEASKLFVRSVEADLAAKLPSDQRDKLTVLRNAANLKPLLAGMKKKHMKKPLTRGRKRKQRVKGQRKN